MKFYKIGFWVVLVLLVVLLILNLSRTWPPRDGCIEYDLIEVRQKIEANYKNLSDLFAADDFEGIAELYKEGAVFMPPGEAPQKGKSEAQNFWKLLKEEGVVDVQFKILEFFVEGEVSYDLTEYHFIEKSEEGKITDSTGNIVTVWMHRVECPREIELQNFNMLKEVVE
ncbi:MAG: nuclear transport factor 2 family protein [Candidatus Aminicenantes bacterium]|nr:nuclear transport factor 2 family protein [Candidatus Aminicenantes bacterium]MDH5384158.1 nuclear transport factor 2 family protein [Candidatus Aminicenantes bacterium]MDH5744438.1 nuclear transport factor 2 family protein [Candidatus Aminicenantes bacterium]